MGVGGQAARKPGFRFASQQREHYMPNSAVEIANLLYRYADFIDSGRLTEAAELFKHAKLKIRGHDELQNGVAALALLQKVVKIDPHGKILAHDVVTNPIIEIDEAANTATCRSYYTVVKGTDTLPLQVIAGGRYHDRFERVGGAWRFSYRDYTLFDLKGEIDLGAEPLGHVNRGSLTERQIDHSRRSTSGVEIANLLYRYSEFIDDGDLPGAAALFKHAKLKIRGHDELQDDVAALSMLQRVVRMYPCGTPRAKHLTTNPIIEIDETANKATCRSYYTVLRQAHDVPLQVVSAGRYHDTFERVDGIWRFAFRDYMMFDMKGPANHLPHEGLGHANRGTLSLQPSDRRRDPPMQSDSAIEIANLIYRYAESIDDGDLPGATALFKGAKLKLRGHETLQDDAATLAMLQRLVKIYPCGTPWTKHVVTNLIIEIDERTDEATCQSDYTVLQGTKEIALQVIAAGRYHDSFKRIDGRWRFAYRDYTLHDLKGNTSGHLQI